MSKDGKKKIKRQEEKIEMKKPEFSYPFFCFKYLQPYSYNEQSIKSDFFISFLERLKKLGELGWNEIGKSAKHSYGTEKMLISKLKPNNLPPIVTEEVQELTVFRANGNNLPFLGLRISNVFQVIFIEAKFGDVYDH